MHWAITQTGKKLIQPENPARILGIEEFKLHNGYRYATRIIDMDTGHILWIPHGKKKQVVYDFIDHVGLEWMSNVEAVACDMNSDFQEAFEEKSSHIQPVFDHFHIVKNFNDKVISAVRKDEQKRLLEEGDKEAARSLKGSKYILTSSRETLQRKDREASEGKIISKGNELFSKEEVRRKGGYIKKYEGLLEQNQLLFSADFVKEKLADACKMIEFCRQTGNAHFKWFANLIENHFEGIIAHATYQITSGKVEGLNNKIKTLRRQGYGYPDDEYFFLKLFDISRKNYVRNLPSHKILE